MSQSQNQQHQQSYVEALEVSPHHPDFERGVPLVEILREEREQVERERRGDVPVIDEALRHNPEFREHLDRRAERRARVIPFLRVRRAPDHPEAA